MTKYNLNTTFYNTKENNDIASKLYGSEGYYIFRNYINEEMLDHCKELFLKEDYKEQIEVIDKLKNRQKYNHFHYIAKYFYKYKLSKDSLFDNLIKNIFHERSKICLQPNSDLFMLDYCQRNNLDINDLNQIYDSIFSHSFVRISHYRDGEGQLWHLDNPGEIQAILFLTEKGKDYGEGGLVVKDESTNTEINLDNIIKAGDLVLINSYKKIHKVEPVKYNENQIGRIHIFIPMIPEYLFPRYYAFKENYFKLFFQKNVDAYSKVIYYILHYISLLKNKPQNILDKGIAHFYKDEIDLNIKNLDFFNTIIGEQNIIYLAPHNNFTRTLFYNTNFEFKGFIDNYNNSQGFNICKFSKNLEYDYVVVLTENKDVLNQFDNKRVIILKNGILQFLE